MPSHPSIPARRSVYRLDEDGRFHPKAVIFGISAGGVRKAYFEDAVIENAPFDDPVGDTVVRVERDAAGLVTFTDLADGSVLAKERDFWFAWYAFYPDTEIYAVEE